MLVWCASVHDLTCSDEAEAKRMEAETMAYERDAAKKDREVSQDALARMAIRNSQLKVTMILLQVVDVGL